jgi:hypothetical protein
MRFSCNLVGHMNFPNAYDGNAIDSAYKQLLKPCGQPEGQNIPIFIPSISARRARLITNRSV